MSNVIRITLAQVLAARTKKRSNVGRGRLFNREQVEELRKLYTETNISLDSLATKHKCSVLTISKAVFGTGAYSDSFTY